MTDRRFLITFLLRMGGFILLLATFAVLLPRQTMAGIHQWLGLGQFPDGPISVYLARSTSALYAMHGAMMLMVSTDVVRYFRFVKLLGWLHAIFGIVVLFTGIATPLPFYWVLMEGPPVIGVGIFLIWLTQKPLDR